MANAVGILEVYGLTTAFVAADAACKAADVTLENFDKNKPANAEKLPVPNIICVKFRGSVVDVTAAIEAAQQAAEKMTGVVSKHVIARPVEDTEMMFKINAFDKN